MQVTDGSFKLDKSKFEFSALLLGGRTTSREREGNKERKENRHWAAWRNGEKRNFLGRCYILVLPLVYDLVLVNIDQPQTQKLYNFII